MNFYPRHLGDYAKDTGHLSLAAHGAYTLLLDRYYSSERPIGREEAFSICHASTKADRAAVTQVLSEFFLWVDGAYRHKRADEEIAKIKAKSAKARQSVRNRWLQQSTDTNVSKTYGKRMPNVILTNNQEPITNKGRAAAGCDERGERQRERAGATQVGKDWLMAVIDGKRDAG